MGASIGELFCGDDAESRLAGYQALLDKQNASDELSFKELNVGQIVPIACSDAESENIELATKALKCLGILLHHPHCVQQISNEVAGTILQKLVGVALSTRKKLCCNYALWCISVQQFDPEVVALHTESLVGAAVHAINNPMGSLSVSYEAIQVLSTMQRVAPSKLKELSHVWAPTIYRQLVGDDKRERELSQNALTDLSLSIYPPSPALIEVVALNINQSLLSKMRTMATNGQAFPAINAWKYYVRLLGDHLARNTSLVNAMLKIPEITLMSNDSNGRIASQVAWESFIDALVPAESGSSPGIIEPKRLKLLLMPILTAQEFETNIAAKCQLLKTWGHLLTRLGGRLDEPLVFEAAVLSVLEAITKADPCKDPYIWQNVVVMMEGYVGTRCLSLPDFSTLGFNEEEHQAVLPPADRVTCVNFRPWDFKQLESILKIVKILWEKGICHLQADSQSTTGKASMAAGTRIWTLIVKAVSDYQQGTVTPSSHQISTVESLLKFVSAACEPDINRSRGREWAIWCWKMIRILVDELGPLVLASSFYITKAPWQDSSQPSSLGIFPATLVIFVWLKLSCYEQLDFQPLQRLVRASYAGLDINGSLQGILSALEALMCNKSAEKVLSQSWIVLADELKNQLEATNDIPWSGVFGFSGVFWLLLFPLKFYREGPTTGSDDVDFKLLGSFWSRLHDTAIRICMLKGGHCSSFLGGLYQRIWKALEDLKTTGEHLVELFGPGVAFALDHVQLSKLPDYMLNRKRRGAHHDVSNVKDLLSVAARLACVSLLAERLLVAFSGFVKRVSTQQDALMLLNVLEEPLVFWLNLGLQVSVSVVEKLHTLWGDLLSCLRTCQPPIQFDSKLLKLQATSLKVALWHAYSPIPNTTLSFWEATYAKRASTLIYPASLLRVFQELKTSTTVTVPSPASALTQPDSDSSIRRSRSPSPSLIPVTPPADELHLKADEELGRSGPQRPRRARVLSSDFRKRMKLARTAGADETADDYVVIPSKEVKEISLTEHQKEVRELQRREGPGVKTYTSANFSQLDDYDEQAQNLPAADLVNEALTTNFSTPRSLEVVMEDAAGQGSDLLVGEEIAPFKLSRGKRTYPMTGDQVKVYVSQDFTSPARKATREVESYDAKRALIRLELLASWNGWDKLGVDELFKARALLKVIQDKLPAVTPASEQV